MQKNELIVSRGEIWYADLSPVVGSEQGGVRPVMIISNDIGNRHSPVVIIAPITSRIQKKRLPTQVLLGRESGLKEVSMVACEQLRTVDKRRLSMFVGRPPSWLVNTIDDAVKVALGLS